MTTYLSRQIPRVVRVLARVHKMVANDSMRGIGQPLFTYVYYIFAKGDFADAAYRYEGCM